MEHVECVYTFGMDEAELERRLRDAETGVLSLARDGDAYSIPVSFHYDDGRVLLRFGVEEGGAKNCRFWTGPRRRVSSSTRRRRANRGASSSGERSPRRRNRWTSRR